MHEQPAQHGDTPATGELALVGRCLAGDAAAQDELVQRYAGLVWSLCRRAGLGRGEAEDVSQEVFWHAFQALPRFRGDSRLSTWLCTLAFRRIVDHRRSPARRDVAAGAATDAGFPQPESPAGEATSPEADADRAQRRRRVREALDGLAEPARSVLVAYYLGELPVREIARSLDMPAGTVKTHLHRGRRVLRDRLRDLKDLSDLC
jgi:RNA polymerase sigma-70 factor (ECF subfamily)